MTLDRKIVRAILIILFSLIGICALIVSFYWIRLLIYGIGWSGGEISYLELIWKCRGFILITAFSFITSYGLIKKLKTGIIFGYPIPIGFLIYLFYEFATNGFNNGDQILFKDIIWAISVVGIASLMIYGLTKVKKTLPMYKTIDYVASGVLTLLLIWSFSFAF